VLHQRLSAATKIACVCLTVLALSAGAAGEAFQSAWPANVDRVWVGPEYWANRLQDWRVAAGRLECVQDNRGQPMRTVHLLTRSLTARGGDLAMTVTTGRADRLDQAPKEAGAGFLVGAGAGELDYRAAALVHHSGGSEGGIIAAMDGAGRAVFRDMATRDYRLLAAGDAPEAGAPAEAEVRLAAAPAGDTYRLTLEVRDAQTGRAVSKAVLEGVSAERLVGNLALVSHPGPVAKKGRGARYWFRDWTVSGSKVAVHDDRVCGPVLCTQYTLSRRTLKMTAQMTPLGESDVQTVTLQVRRDGDWATVATAEVIAPGYTAPFRVEDWDATRDTPYRVVYELERAGGATTPYAWSGTVRREPRDKQAVTVAAFTGNHNVRRGGVDRGTFDWTPAAVWFPHADLTGPVARLDPDVLFFSGDQVYEGASPTRTERVPLDYMYKWYLWCWAFRDLAKDRPCVCIPDDHDVYHGNVWGAGGRHADRQDDGGYTMPASFVNMVQRTQTSHLPDPYDATPVEQGIEVYYTAMDYAGVSFAIVEDRKFKSSPTVTVPEGEIVNGWSENPDFDPVTQADVPGATLLGDRQLTFLRDWAADWRQGVWMKAVLSQTIFANVATLPYDATSDKVVPKLERTRPDEYPPNDRRVADADSNGWPQTGRNKALRAIRRGFAVHIAGDQHLASTVQYGVDDWRDAAFALCVPSIANFFPRRWYPPEPGRNRPPGAPRYTGDYRDGFGNRMTVHAVANPVVSGREPAALHDCAPGYGIVTFDKAARTIALACWPRWEDPSKPGAKPYPGWPVIVTQDQNYGRKAVAYLPTLEVNGMTDPVVQIVDEADGEVVYTLRIEGRTFRPKVFKEGRYTIKVGEPDAGRTKTFTGVNAIAPEDRQRLPVAF